MHETLRKFVARNQPTSKMSSLQVLHPSNCLVWFSAVVLQQRYQMKILNKMQRRAAIWILGAFKTSPMEGIEALVGLISIRFHLQKIAKRSLIHSFKLPDNHILKNLLNDVPPSNKLYNTHNIGSLTNSQRSLTKGHLVNSNIKSYGIFPSFSPLDPEFFPGHCIIDKFSNYFSFNLVNKKGKNQNNIRG